MTNELLLSEAINCKTSGTESVQVQNHCVKGDVNILMKIKTTLDLVQGSLASNNMKDGINNQMVIHRTMLSACESCEQSSYESSQTFRILIQ